MAKEKLTDLLAEVAKIRAEVKAVQTQEKSLKSAQRELEIQITIRMREQGLDKICMYDFFERRDCANCRRLGSIAGARSKN